MLNNIYISGIGLTWLWCMVLLMYCWILFASTLLRLFASIRILAYSSCGVFIWFWYQHCLRISFSSIFFWKNLRVFGINSSWNIWYYSPMKICDPEYCSWDVLNTDSIFLFVVGIFRLSVSSWFSFCRWYVSKNWSICSRLSSLLSCTVHDSFL